MSVLTGQGPSTGAESDPRHRAAHESPGFLGALPSQLPPHHKCPVIPVYLSKSLYTWLLGEITRLPGKKSPGL